MHLTCSSSSNISNLHFAWVSPLQGHLQLSSVHHEGTGAGVGLSVGKADVQLRQYVMRLGSSLSWSPSHLCAVANNIPTGICHVDHSLGGGEGRRAGVEGVVAVAQHLVIVYVIINLLINDSSLVCSSSHS